MALLTYEQCEAMSPRSCVLITIDQDDGTELKMAFGRVSLASEEQFNAARETKPVMAVVMMVSQCCLTHDYTKVLECCEKYGLAETVVPLVTELRKGARVSEKKDSG